MVCKLISLVAGAAFAIAPLPSLADGAQPAQSAPPAVAAVNTGSQAQAGPLAAAGAASVKQAQAYTEIPWVFVTGLSILAVSVGLALAHHNSTTSTTATTGTN